jgi:predicted ATPase
MAIRSDEPVPPRRVTPELSADLDELILQMLEKPPVRRPGAGEVARLLAAPLRLPRRTAPATVDQTLRLVGRGREQAELRHALTEAANGHGLLICVTGEPGIGKSALVEDFLARQALLDEGCRVARGRCSERLAGAEAYLPILDALHNLIRGTAGDAPSMARLLKTVAPLWYSQVASVSTDMATAGPATAAVGSRERLKRELVAFLEEASRTQPLVLFIDDIHWADDSTVDMLGYVASRFGAMRLLVVVTYRPEELLRERHPFLRVKQDLQARGCCFELELGFLNPTDLETYLRVEFREHRFPPSFAALVHEKTEGNPLFMVEVLRYLRDQGVLSKQGGAWALSQALPDIARSLPESVRSMIQRKIDVLSEDDRRLLLAASVQGYEFDAAIVAHVLGNDPADVEERLDRLDRVHAFVRAVREREFPDHTVTVRYRFVHVLYQNLLYATLTHARKIALALGVVRKMEASYGAHINDIAGEAAVLCEVGREFSRAADYFKTAARHAARVFAYQEAALLAQRGLDMLEKLPESPERKRQELALLLTLGVPLIVARGFGDPRVGAVYGRAHALCLDLNAPADLMEIHWGLANFDLVTLRLDAADESAGALRELAERAADHPRLMQAHHLLGLVRYHRGEFPRALEHVERVATLYNPQLDRTHAATYGWDTRVAAGSYAACAYWIVGRPDRARTEMELVLRLARALGHAHTLAYGLFFASVLHQFLREWEAARTCAEELRSISSDKGLVHFLTASRIFLGLAEAHLGDLERGIDEMRQGLAAYRATGAQTSRPRVQAQLAELLGRAGRLEEGLAIATNEIASLGSARFHLSELYRVTGELFAASARGVVTSDAESFFRRAIDLAREQKAKSFELRAAMSLFRHRSRLGAADEARALLGGVYASFTEGLETADLRDARALWAAVPQSGSPS